jgi:hypothetical protein
LARLGKHEEARLTLERASKVAEQAGDANGAGLAALFKKSLHTRLLLRDFIIPYQTHWSSSLPKAELSMPKLRATICPELPTHWRVIREKSNQNRA